MSTYADTQPTVTHGTPAEATARLLAAIDRAVARAVEMAEAGVKPVLRKSELSRNGLSTLQRWIVPSRTAAGAFHTVTLVADCEGLHTECSCPATGVCWHRALARRCALHQAPYSDGRRSAPAISLADLHGHVALDRDPWPAALDDAAAFAAVS